MSKIAVILENAPDCEMDRVVIDVPNHADDEAISGLISAVIEGWILSPGDTIRIIEVQS